MNCEMETIMVHSAVALGSLVIYSLIHYIWKRSVPSSSTLVDFSLLDINWGDMICIYGGNNGNLSNKLIENILDSLEEPGYHLNCDATELTKSHLEKIENMLACVNKLLVVYNCNKLYQWEYLQEFMYHIRKNRILVILQFTTVYDNQLPMCTIPENSFHFLFPNNNERFMKNAQHLSGLSQKEFKIFVNPFINTSFACVFIREHKNKHKTVKNHTLYNVL